MFDAFPPRPNPLARGTAVSRGAPDASVWLTSSFPSPWPSPLGRGKCAARLQANQKGLVSCRSGKQFSLSPRERAGVRGNKALGDLRHQIALRFKDSKPEIFRGILSPRQRAGVRGKGRPSVLSSAPRRSGSRGEFPRKKISRFGALPIQKLCKPR